MVNQLVALFERAIEAVPLLVTVTVKARLAYSRRIAACSDVSASKPWAPLIASQSSETL